MPEQVVLCLFIAVPFLALLAAVPLLWVAGFLSWQDAAIAVVMYVVAGHGITVGFHRYFTHRAFRAQRWLRVTLAVAGSMAIQGPVIQWVADHRKHHRFSDRDGDPHSPWRYGSNAWALAKGFFYAHRGLVVRLGEDLRAALRPGVAGRPGHPLGVEVVPAVGGRVHA